MAESDSGFEPVIPGQQLTLAQMSPTTIHGPLDAQINGQWVNVPGFDVYGQKSTYEEGNGTTTIYYDQRGNPVTDPMQDPKYGGGVGGTNYFTQNADGSPGALFGSVGTGDNSFGSTFMQQYGAPIAMALMGGFMGAAAAGVGAVGAGGAAAASTGELGSLGAAGSVGSGAAVAGGAGAGFEGLGGYAGGTVPTAGGAALDAGTSGFGGAGLGTQGTLGSAFEGSTFEPFGDAATMQGAGITAPGAAGVTGGLPGGTWDPTASGMPGNATAGIQDFVKGAIQSGNYGQLIKALPQLPTSLQNILKPILGGNGPSTGGSIGSLIANAATAWLKNSASDKAASAIKDAAAQAAAQQQAIYNQQQANAAPFRDAGVKAVGQLSAGTQPGGQFNKPYTLADFESGPQAGLYDFANKQAQEAMIARLNSQGMGSTTNAVTGAGKLASDLAAQNFNTGFNQNLATNNMALGSLQSLAGEGVSATSGLNADLTNLGTSLGNATTTIGNATAANTLNNGNNWANVLGTGAKDLLTMNTLSSIFQ